MSDQDEGVRVFVHAALAAMKGAGHLTETVSGACCDCERDAETGARTASVSEGPRYLIGARAFCAVCATRRATVAQKLREVS